MRVILTVKSLFPSYGGPAFSVSQLALALADAGIAVGLWAADMSAEKTTILPQHSCVLPMSGPIHKAVDCFGRADILHDNGIWLPYNHCIALLAARRNLLRIVSTRGMLEPWAMNYKRLKKTIAWHLYQRRDLRCASFHHATAETEARTLQQLGLGVPIGVIPNGINYKSVCHHKKSRFGIRIALFVGRIHPVKGLSLLIEAWAGTRPEGWQLHIAGPDEVGYRANLEEKISAASLSEVIRFLGPLDGEAKERAFQNADLFILPSFSESFGIAIGEALAYGLPVLTTTTTPWPSILRRGCGWSVTPTLEGITVGLHEATALDSSKLLAMGKRAQEIVRTDFAWAHIANQFVNTYEALLRKKALDEWIISGSTSNS